MPAAWPASIRLRTILREPNFSAVIDLHADHGRGAHVDSGGARPGGIPAVTAAAASQAQRASASCTQRVTRIPCLHVPAQSDHGTSSAPCGGWGEGAVGEATVHRRLSMHAAETLAGSLQCSSSPMEPTGSVRDSIMLSTVMVEWSLHLHACIGMRCAKFA